MAKTSPADTENTDNTQDASFEGGNAVFEDGDQLVVDLTGVKESSFEAIPQGRYLIEVANCEYALSKSSGAPMLSMRLRVVEGEFENRQLFFFASFSPKALPGTKANLAKLDPELVAAPFNPRQVADSGQLLGKRAIARVRVEKGDDGESRNAVGGLMSADGAGAAGGGNFFGG